MCLHSDADADAENTVSACAYLSRSLAKTEIAELSVGCGEVSLPVGR
jgi:hypothetical protein